MRKSITLLAIVATACFGLVSAASAKPARHTIPGSHPSWATGTSRVGATNANQLFTFRVYLALRDPAGASATAAAVSSPASPAYHHYLSTAQVKARYAPSNASVAAVKSWLRKSGFRVGTVPSNNQYVSATGSAAQVASAFGVRLGQYRVRGKVLRSADRDLSVPVSLARTVTGVVGIDQALDLVRPLHTNGNNRPGTPSNTTPAAVTKAAPNRGIPQPGGFRNAPPCSHYWAQATATIPSYPPYGTHVPYAPCGYTPPQLRSSYGFDSVVNGGIDGTGVTVAIIDAFSSPSILADAQEYAKRNDPAHPMTSKQFKQINFKPTKGLIGLCDASGWFGEETLDVEAVHAMAPGANILYVGASDCGEGLDVALNTVIAGHLAQIVSNSYGDIGEKVPPAEVAVFQNMAVQATIEGIGLYFSSGDDGDETDNLKQPSPDFSASSPWVTAVGGTSLGIGADGRRVLETGWETAKSTLNKKATAWKPPAPGAFLYGSGGGTSRLFPEPFYQGPVVPTALAVQNQTVVTRGRVVPDVAMVGDPNTGMLEGETQSFPEGVKYDEYRIGGTSLSSPLFAGVMALADQMAGVAHGFVNPLLYSKAGTNAFNDVTHVKAADVRVDYNNGIDAGNGTTESIRGFDDRNLTIHTARGYDNVTGLGTPNGKTFLSRIS